VHAACEPSPSPFLIDPNELHWEFWTTWKVSFRQTEARREGWEFAGKKKRFSVEQIVAVLKQAELGMPVADIVRQVGISEQTFYRWKKQYAGMESDQVRELKQLQDENARLKKLVAELSLDKAMLQDVNSKKWPGPR
jgi:putative transposase